MPTSILREGELQPRQKKALEFMRSIQSAFYDKKGGVHGRTWNELMKMTGLKRKTLWKYLKELKKMGVIRHIQAHYEISNVPITVRGEDPEGYFLALGTEYEGVPKYERGVLKRRRIKYGGEETVFVAIRRPVEESKKTKYPRIRKKDT